MLLYGFTSLEYSNVSKLLVGDAHHSHMTKLRKKTLHTLDMHLCIVHAGTVTHIDGQLKHRETISLQLFAKKSISPLVLLGLGRQIKKHHHPHNTVLTKSIYVHHISNLPKVNAPDRL